MMLVIGVGNDYRSDDAIGLLVARALEARNLPGVTVVESTGEGTGLLELFGKDEDVILIDAILSGTRLGTIQRFDAHLYPIPTHFFLHSTHAFSVAEAIELARELKRLPQCLIVYGIEGESFEYGEKLSPRLAKMMPQIIEQINEYIQSSALHQRATRST